MKHFSYIKGSSIFEISGENRNRLINVCTKNDILLLVKYKLNKCLFYVHFKDKDRFLIYVKKLGLHYKLIKEKGLPILYYKYKVRYWVFVFLIGFALLLWKFSLYIWNIKVIGTSNYTSEQILKYVSTYEVPIGTKISEINCTLLEKSLRQKYDNLGWINCYITGTQLTIEVLETIPPMKAKINDSPCHIIAIKNAQYQQNPPLIIHFSRQSLDFFLKKHHLYVPFHYKNLLLWRRLTKHLTSYILRLATNCQWI